MLPDLFLPTMTFWPPQGTAVTSQSRSLGANPPLVPRTSGLFGVTVSAFRLKTLAPLPRLTKAPETDVLFAKKTRRPSLKRPSALVALRSALDWAPFSSRPLSCTRISQLGITCAGADAAHSDMTATRPPTRLYRLYASRLIITPPSRAGRTFDRERPNECRLG